MNQPGRRTAGTNNRGTLTLLYRRPPFLPTIHSEYIAGIGTAASRMRVQEGWLHSEGAAEVETVAAAVEAAVAVSGDGC